MSTIPSVSGQGKSIVNTESVCSEDTHTQLSVPEKRKKQVQIEEKITSEELENNLKSQEEIEEISQEKIKDESSLEVKESVLNLPSSKEQFKNAENLIIKLYSEIFSKTENFKPSKNQTIGDLLIYFGIKAKGLDLYQKFVTEYKVEIENDSVRESENYIPYAVKLTVFVDKKYNTSYSKKLVEYLLMALLYLDGDNESVVKDIPSSLNAIYDYLIKNKVDVL